MQKIFLLILFVGFMCSANAQNYNVSLIPDSLKENANSVKRFEEIHVIIKSIDKAIVKHKYAITILNSEGAEDAQYENWYDKLSSLSDISGNLYDAAGKKLKSVKKRDIADISATDGFSLMLDDRKKKHNFYCSNYPYTVEYEDEQEMSGIYSLPRWLPVEGESSAVQESNFEVEMPLDYELRYKQFNYIGDPNIKTGKTKNYVWGIKNVKAIKFEPFQPPLNEVTPSVYIAPVDFSIEGYVGNMNSWQNLGLFNVQLNKGRDQLPDNIKQDIHKLVDGISDRAEKVNVLYQYLQKNTRYVSVQLGIGGWQPFDAKYVATNKYGDCKALSNYMVSLLKEVGIKANYVIIKAGNYVSKGLMEDFPTPYFNHIVTCVPNGKDSIWLECTSQTEPAGYMGLFTGNRKALLIDEDGGHIVSTPFYTSKDNLQLHKVNANIDADGNLAADLFSTYTGTQQELQHAFIYSYTKEERDKKLNSLFNIPTYKIENPEYREKRAAIPSIEENLHVVANNYASITGKRLSIQPNVFNKSTYKPTNDERHFDIINPHAFKDVDSIHIVIPSGFNLESLPKDLVISNKFGNYSIIYKVNGNQIDVVRIQVREAATYPKSDYKDLVKYFDDIYKADRNKIVFIKKEG